MDGFSKREYVFVLGATNSVNSLVKAAVRQGRFDKTVHVPTPDLTGRVDIFELYMKKVNISLNIIRLS